MSYIVNEYEDLVKELEQFNNLLEECKDLYFSYDFDLYNSGMHYEDIECDLSNKLEETRENVLKVIKAYNDLLDDLEKYGDIDLKYWIAKEKNTIVVLDIEKKEK